MLCTPHLVDHLHQQAFAHLNLKFACRDEIASCSERAYKQLSVSEAQKLMMFASSQEAAEFAEQVYSVAIYFCIACPSCFCYT